MNNRISVVIAAYNREGLIRRTIDSVLAQTNKAYEIIVVNDGSTDRTHQVLESYGELIKIAFQQNKGPEIAYRTGVSIASGEYIAFLDSDDLFFPHALETYDKVIRSLQSPPLIIGAIQRFWNDSEAGVIPDMADVIELNQYRDYLSKDIAIGLAQSRIVMRRDVFVEAYRKIDSAKACYMNDYNLLLQAGVYGPCAIIMKPITVAYRQHEGQGSLRIEKMARGALSMMGMVVKGECSGSRSRSFMRFAYLGGPISEWARKAYTTRQYGLALRLVTCGGPAIGAAGLRKLCLKFRKTRRVILLPK
jgi:glycosyltransferase involved in cell wall biosynthesis